MYKIELSGSKQRKEKQKMTEMNRKNKANTLHVVSQWQKQSSLMADGGNLVNLITKNYEREHCWILMSIRHNRKRKSLKSQSEGRMLLALFNYARHFLQF